jgi:hypothetical protein
VLEFLRESWVIGWLGFLVSGVALIPALWRAKLEKEKLELEIRQLRNSPEIVGDRRAIYERLREVVHAITRDANATIKHVQELHSICHDGAFRFSEEILEGLELLIGHVVALHVGRQVMDGSRSRVTGVEWNDIVEKQHAALTAIAEYEKRLVEIFKPYLSL